MVYIVSQGLSYCRLSFEICCDPFTGEKEMHYFETTLVNDECKDGCTANCNLTP